MRRVSIISVVLILMLAFGVGAGQMRGDRRSFVSQLSAELIEQAEYLAESSYDYYMGWNGMISNSEQAILFKSEEFAAACRLFDKLLLDQSGYYRHESLRTNLHSAYLYVSASFRQLEDIMRQGGMREGFGTMRRDGRRFEPRTYPGPRGTYGLAECRRILTRIESEFSRWR